MWLGEDDWAQAVVKTVTPPLDATGILNVVSLKEGMRWDLEAGRRLIGYEPAQRRTIVMPSKGRPDTAVLPEGSNFHISSSFPPYSLQIRNLG